mmetsp:Transcript_20214/g.47159  ORF Transcript_20214/g.47159 Transcript_20214/m.47159 type:complete len:293 (+) Transcript_20214:138-1016(+)
MSDEKDDEEKKWEIDPQDLVYHEEVGSGCTADVWRGSWKGSEVAIKRINWDKSTMGKKEQRAFEREVAIMPKVNHENLVNFIGISSMQKPLLIITEFCAGGCVFDLLHTDEGDLSQVQQHKMCMDVALAMNYLHSFDPQIIHRDLKSLNLLLSKRITNTSDIPLVKVSDFGLSRMKDTPQWGKLTMAAGTCHWMAPEVFVGTNYDVKVDVYSYAMIIFEIICREIPFEDEEPASVGKLAVKGQRPELEAVPPDIPDLWRDLMIACWAHDPESRPAFSTIVATLREVGKLIPR